MFDAKIKIGVAAAFLGLSGAALPATAQNIFDVTGNGQQCKVKINRGQPANVFDSALQLATDGRCVCHVYTGSASQSEAVEAKVAAVSASKTCPDARVMKVDNLTNLNVPAKGSAGNPVGVVAAIGISP